MDNLVSLCATRTRYITLLSVPLYLGSAMCSRYMCNKQSVLQLLSLWSSTYHELHPTAHFFFFLLLCCKVLVCSLYFFLLHINNVLQFCACVQKSLHCVCHKWFGAARQPLYLWYPAQHWCSWGSSFIVSVISDLVRQGSHCIYDILLHSTGVAVDHPSLCLS